MMDEFLNLIHLAEGWKLSATAAREAFLARLRSGVGGSGNIVELKRQADEAQANYEQTLKALGACVLEHQAEVIGTR